MSDRDDSAPPTIGSNHGKPVAAIINWTRYQQFEQWLRAEGRANHD